jgi:hypothetical protein
VTGVPEKVIFQSVTAYNNQRLSRACIVHLVLKKNNWSMKFKMAATAGLSLTLDPMGKMFQNASSLKPLGQLKPNFPGMIIGRSSVFYADEEGI